MQPEVPGRRRRPAWAGGPIVVCLLLVGGLVASAVGAGVQRSPGSIARAGVAQFVTLDVESVTCDGFITYSYVNSSSRTFDGSFSFGADDPPVAFQEFGGASVLLVPGSYTSQTVQGLVVYDPEARGFTDPRVTAFYFDEQAQQGYVLDELAFPDECFSAPGPSGAPSSAPSASSSGSASVGPSLRPTPRPRGTEPSSAGPSVAPAPTATLRPPTVTPRPRVTPTVSLASGGPSVQPSGQPTVRPTPRPRR